MLIDIFVLIADIVFSYHVLLLSQGATWSGPPAFPRTDSGVKEHISSLQAQFSTAKNIVLVGGGAVGFELAGELKDVWPVCASSFIFSSSSQTFTPRTRK